MKVCHDPSIEIMTNFLGTVGRRHTYRALDVAGGDGRFAAKFLMKYYAKVDLFDQCPKAIDRATQAMSGISHLGYVCKATM